MSIKQNGGVFGRNPTFNDVTIEGDLIINGEVFSGLDFQGSWNASTNSPTLASGTGTKGEFYIVSVAGTTSLDGITNWGVGDWALFSGSVWQRVEGGADGNFNDLTSNNLTVSTLAMFATTDAAVGVGNTNTGTAIGSVGYTAISRTGSNTQPTLFLNKNTSDGRIVQFSKSGSEVGNVSVTASATAYNTSSDYRLKENVVLLTGSIARLKALKPSCFNFIVDPNTTVDGFLAHEAAEVVPASVSGSKDATDENGNPDYQSIDQSKIVPLLTAALQEAITKIESLEERVTALEV
jgi:hypothetical protein|tara:strand:- start:90 stop:971 length:882 start_codon:yes stop_codon:yes gene_type:complete